MSTTTTPLFFAQTLLHHHHHCSPSTFIPPQTFPCSSLGGRRSSHVQPFHALDNKGATAGGGSGTGMPNSKYVVPMDKKGPSVMNRPLVEILRDLNKRIPDKIVREEDNSIPWYHANRLLSFYAPGWCGEIRDVIFSDAGSVTVVYRVAIRGTDGEAHREATGTVSLKDSHVEDPVIVAEQIAFCKACARFGLGLYLYHDDHTL